MLLFSPLTTRRFITFAEQFKVAAQSYCPTHRSPFPLSWTPLPPSPFLGPLSPFTFPTISLLDVYDTVFTNKRYLKLDYSQLEPWQSESKNLAGTAPTRDNEKARIVPRHLQLAPVQGEQELDGYRALHFDRPFAY
ncbi:hypothetical protein BDV93DRAFT_556714 [Ceratobasidium sp. AG-I]|nr:hypothetical protein BDV93DRAFT_556714 [Ceratobasidium sp. AG-I]